MRRWIMLGFGIFLALFTVLIVLVMTRGEDWSFFALFLFFFVSSVIVCSVSSTLNSKEQYIGKPRTEISPGLYDVSFVHRAMVIGQLNGGYVNVGVDYTNVGVEKLNDETLTGAGLILYQFPAKEFTPEIAEGVAMDVSRFQLRHTKVTDGSGTHNVYELVPRSVKALGVAN